jgi:hypothetical protein
VLELINILFTNLILFTMKEDDDLEKDDFDPQEAWKQRKGESDEDYEERMEDWNSYTECNS